MKFNKQVINLVKNLPDIKIIKKYCLASKNEFGCLCFTYKPNVPDTVLSSVTDSILRLSETFGSWLSQTDYKYRRQYLDEFGKIFEIFCFISFIDKGQLMPWSISCKVLDNEDVGTCIPYSLWNLAK